MNRKREKFVDTCAVKTCINLRGRDDITFFRFPLDPERSKLWINACNRDDLEGKESRLLYENCRVCSRHFTATMFCSEKKKLITGDAIPTLYLNTAQSQHPSVSTMSSSASLRQDQSSTFDERLSTTSSIIHPTTCSTAKRKAENQLSGMEKHRRQGTITSATASLHVFTQTPPKLSASTPSMDKLKHKINALKKANARLKNKIKLIGEEKVTGENLVTEIDQFLPADSAQFFKVQLKHLMKKPKGRRYTQEFKRLCLSLYVVAPKVYGAMIKTFLLPSKRSLERYVEKFKPALSNTTFKNLN